MTPHKACPVVLRQKRDMTISILAFMHPHDPNKALILNPPGLPISFHQTGSNLVQPIRIKNTIPPSRYQKLR